MLNLIEDPWIPVRCSDGAHRVICPWQVAEPDIVATDWPRADMNVACLELLIGLVFLADPPSSTSDWHARQDPDADRLRERMAPFCPAFELTGDGPRFLQDLEILSGAPSPTDMLFIDSAGANTAKNNADIMVHRQRYPHLDLPTAAMALYTFQSYAPSGGAGNRTSMRGGGPLVTLIDPRLEGGPLWDLIWANVPNGSPGQIEDLPWMRDTLVSDTPSKIRTPPEQLFDVEAFFGMPRRLRLVVEADMVTGVIQRPYGTNYTGWKHPLSPYYRMKEGSEWLPKHPRAGRFGFRNWLGVVAHASEGSLSELAYSVRNWNERGGDAALIVAGWSMDNMKPRDFVMSVQPYLDLDIDSEIKLVGLIEAAEAASLALRDALKPVLAAGEAREMERERFFQELELRFLDHLEMARSGGDPTHSWLKAIRQQVIAQFEDLSIQGLDQREYENIKAIVDADKFLRLAFAGYGKLGKAIYGALGLELPSNSKGQQA